MKFCKHCGKELLPDAKFCKHCGQSITDQEEIPQQSQKQDSASDHTSNDNKPHEQKSTDTSSQDIPSEEEQPSVEEGKRMEPQHDETDTEAKDQMPPVPAQSEQGVNQNTNNQDINQTTADQTSKGQGIGGLGGSRHSGTTNNQPSKPPKKKMSKMTKIAISSVAVLVVIVGAGYFVGNSIFSADKAIEKFEEAIDDGDSKAVSKLLNSKDKDLKIDDSSVEGFIDYYNDNPDELEDVVDHLTEQGEKDGKSDDGYAINLKKDGKKFLVFDNYMMQVSPVYFDVYTNYADTEITLDDDVVLTADSDEFTEEIGPYLPGKYTFVAN